MERKELISLAKELSQLDNLSSRREDVILLKKEAKKFLKGDEENYLDKLENEELEKYYNEIAKRESSLLSSALDEKKALIEEAKKVLNEKNMKVASNKMNDIFNRFKDAGRLTKEQDDALWAELKEIKEKFNKIRDDYFANLKKAQEENKVKKENIIKEAHIVLSIEDIKEANAKMASLMNEWKKVGFSSKEDDNALWDEFNSIRQSFFKKRDEYYDSMQKVYDEKASRKEELIKKAKLILANSEFVDEEINQIKELRSAWKEIGFTGKERDDALYLEFNGTLNKYFDEMRKYR